MTPEPKADDEQAAHSEVSELTLFDKFPPSSLRESPSSFQIANAVILGLKTEGLAHRY